MKITGSLLVGVWLATAPLWAGAGRWTSQGPYGADVEVVRIDPQNPSILYAATHGGGVFRSDDRAASWQRAGKGLEDPRILDLELDPQTPSTVYAVSLEGGILESLDRGEHWTAQTAGLEEARRFSSLVVGADATTLYLSTHGQGVFKSLDSGTSWRAINEGLGSLFVNDVAVDTTGSAVYAATSEGAFKSTDGGATWGLANTGLEDVVLEKLIVDPQTAVVYGIGSSFSLSLLFRSLDGGASWQRLRGFTGSRFVRALAIHPQNSATLFIATNRNSQVLRSDDGGDTWQETATRVPELGLQDLAIDPQQPTLLYVGTTHDGGVLTSTDSGDSWQAASQGLTNTEVLALELDPLVPSTLYATTNAAVFKSPDGGQSWNRLELGLVRNFESLAIDPFTPSTVYAGGRNLGLGSGLNKTTDGGETWESVGDPFAIPGSLEDLELDPSAPSTLYIGTGNGLLKSLDGGETVTEIGDGLPSNIIFDLEVTPTSPQTVYVVTIDFGLNGRVSRNTDGGETWRRINNGLPGSLLLSLAVDPEEAGTVYVAGLNGVFKTTDGGASWQATAPLPDETAIALAIDGQNPEVIYASTFNGVYKSPNRGEHWFPTGDGLTDVVFDLEVDPQDPAKIYAGTQGGGAFDLVQDLVCVPGPTTLCIDDRAGDRRFQVTLDYDTTLGGGLSGRARAIELKDLGVERGGILWFFDPANPEVLIKILDGCGVNDRFWVFYAATTTVGFRLRVTDTLAGVSRIYGNTDLTAAATLTDIEAFPTSCLAAAAEPAVSRTPRVQAAQSSEPAGGVGGCIADASTLCLDDEPGDRRFKVTARYETIQGGGQSGQAQAIPLAPLGIERGGILWFFDPTNPEVLIKVLDGCEINGHFWVFFGATTNVGLTLTVEDTVAGEERVFTNPDLSPALPITEIRAFATCGL